MKTIVYQSYRTHDVAPWLASCLRSVKAWAAASGHDYRFFDDRFFDYAPGWFRQRASHQVCPVTDLARLVAARELMAEGYERTIWVDADMLVFAPAELRVDVPDGFTFCHEVWPATDAQGRRGVSRRVNNSIAAFTRGTPSLDFLIDAALRIASHKTQLGKLDIGTVFLTQLRAALPVPLLMNVGMFGPAIVADLAAGDGPHLREYAQHLDRPLACANFCASLAAGAGGGYEAAVARCLETGGAVVNRLVPA